MSILSVHDIQGISTFGNEIRIPTGSSLNVVDSATVGILNATTTRANSIQHTNGTTALTIDSSGRVQTPNQASFRVYLPTGAVNSTITFGANEYNIGNHMNAATGIFTAPITGRYLLTFAILCGNPMGPYVRINFCKNSTVIDTTLGDALYGAVPSYGSPSMAQIFSLAANDTIRLRVEGTKVYGTSYGSFSGCLIG